MQLRAARRGGALDRGRGEGERQRNRLQRGEGVSSGVGLHVEAGGQEEGRCRTLACWETLWGAALWPSGALSSFPFH